MFRVEPKYFFLCCVHRPRGVVTHIEGLVGDFVQRGCASSLADFSESFTTSVLELHRLLRRRPLAAGLWQARSFLSSEKLHVNSAIAGGCIRGTSLSYRLDIDLMWLV